MWTRINVLLQRRNCSEGFPVWTEDLSVIQFVMLPFDLKRSFTKTRFRCNFCSDESVQTWLRLFQRPIQYGMFHLQQRNRPVLFRSRNCFQNSIARVSRSPVRYTFCYAPFHSLVQCPKLCVPDQFSSRWLEKYFAQKMYIRDIQDLGSSQIHCLRTLA